MDSFTKKSFETPDEVRSMDKTSVAVVELPQATLARMTFQPGWKWSECVKPVVGTDSCQAAHLGAVVSGRLHVVLDDGRTSEAGPGDCYSIPPGHDAWVVGDEPFVALEMQSAASYGKAD
jgi:hypothetical protein